MRTLALTGFVAVVAVGAVMLARQPTVARGHVLEAELLEQLRDQGVTGMACDREVRIGRGGAVFTCVASLAHGGTQTVEYAMDREGGLTASLKAAAEGPANAERGAGSAADRGDRQRIPASGDPWAN